MIDLASLAWLQSPAGHALLAELAERELADADALGELQRLRRSYPPEQARAALDQALLRRRARAKFPAASKLFFTREALEQASAAPVAAQRATRFAPYALVADLCCGIGGDALALAAAGPQVVAVDRDELRLAMAEANARALGLAGQIRFVQADLLAALPPTADAIFCDPGRRAGGRRHFHVDEYEPPLSAILAWRTQCPALAVKLAPGVALAELPDAGEVEFVSLDGELKEAALWCGPLQTAHRRATVIRRRHSSPASAVTGQIASPEVHTLVAEAAHSAPLAQPLAFLYEPDPAVIRAGLVADLAARLGAAQLDAQIAYLTADECVDTPFARAWPIFEWLPFNLKGLRARLRARDAGVITVKKRGSPLDTDVLARQLRGDGPRELVVVLTKLQDRPVALICGLPVQC